MKDLILRAKAMVLEQSLEQVETVVDSVKNRRQEVFQLSDLLGQTLQLSSVDARDAIDRSLSLLRRNAAVEETRQQLEEADKAIGNIQETLTKAVKIVTEMQTRSVQIKEDLDKTLRMALGRQARRSSTKLDEIHHKLNAAHEAERKGDTSTANDLLQKAWMQYSDEVYKDCQYVFEEYVDFLGGLALRDAFVDLGICQIADELIIKWEKDVEAPWNSLTIPAHKETLEMSIARIIRLGFPEWTIWALPLTARGFGDVVIGQSDDLKGYITTQISNDQSRSHLHNFLADAFATYAMGPAYVYAAILLRFDPFLAYTDNDGEPASAKRAYVMFTMLRQMNEAARKKSPIDPYGSIIEGIEEEWNAALIQVKASGTLQDTDKEQLKRWVTYLFKYLEDKTYVLYSHESWLQIQDLSSKLWQNNIEAINLNLVNLRDILNAAWSCRIDQKGDMNNIAMATKELCERIYARNRERINEISYTGARLDSRSSMRWRG